MENYKFTFDEKNYELTKDNCDYIENDENAPVLNFQISDVLTLLNEGSEVNFDIEYYDLPCENCLAGKKEKVKFFPFLEYHFTIFTKESSYVISPLSKNYEGESYNKLLREGKVDNSYIVSVTVCTSCSHYSISMEQCEI